MILSCLHKITDHVNKKFKKRENGKTYKAQ